jgi:hypothetical protein
MPSKAKQRGSENMTAVAQKHLFPVTVHIPSDWEQPDKGVKIRADKLIGWAQNENSPFKEYRPYLRVTEIQPGFYYPILVAGNVRELFLLSCIMDCDRLMPEGFWALAEVNDHYVGIRLNDDETEELFVAPFDHGDEFTHEI